MIPATKPQERVAPRRWTRQEYEQLASLGFLEIFRNPVGERYPYHLILAPDSPQASHPCPRSAPVANCTHPRCR
jgi:hypothetical protein